MADRRDALMPVRVKWKWWAWILFCIYERLLVWGLIEPTVQRVDRFLGFLQRHEGFMFIVGIPKPGEIK